MTQTSTELYLRTSWRRKGSNNTRAHAGLIVVDVTRAVPHSTKDVERSFSGSVCPCSHSQSEIKCALSVPYAIDICYIKIFQLHGTNRDASIQVWRCSCQLTFGKLVWLIPSNRQNARNGAVKKNVNKLPVLLRCDEEVGVPVPFSSICILGESKSTAGSPLSSPLMLCTHTSDLLKVSLLMEKAWKVLMYITNNKEPTEKTQIKLITSKMKLLSLSIMMNKGRRVNGRMSLGYRKLEPGLRFEPIQSPGATLPPGDVRATLPTYFGLSAGVLVSLCSASPDSSLRVLT